MKFMRNHWFDLGVILGGFLICGLFWMKPTGVQLVLWVSLLSLFVHQFEEYRFPGYFPGMINVWLFESDRPERYPLNSQTSLIVNVVVGWFSYLLAALFASQWLWLGIATILVSLGNVFAHTVLFNRKGGTYYNPGLLTCWLLFVPVIVWFFVTVFREGLANTVDWVIGIPLGVVLNYVGIIKLIDWLRDKDSPYVFPVRCMPPERK